MYVYAQARFFSGSTNLKTLNLKSTSCTVKLTETRDTNLNYFIIEVKIIFQISLLCPCCT